MGPSHKVYLDFVAQTACSGWETPLGMIPIDVEAVEKLEAASTEFKFSRIQTKFEENEHSLEMHCPYIRKIFKGKDIKMVPLMVGDIPKDKWAGYAKLLLPLFLDERTLFIVSTDFCHWGERFDFQHRYPEEQIIWKSIEKLDRCGMDKIEAQSFSEFEKYLSDTKNTICGRRPIALLLSIIEEAQAQGGKFETKFVKYDQSSQVTDADDSSVSYASSYTI